MAQDSWWDGDNGRPFREPVSHGGKRPVGPRDGGAQASDGASSGDMGLALIDQRGLGASQAYFTAYSTTKPMGPLGGFVFGEYLWSAEHLGNPGFWAAPPGPHPLVRNVSRFDLRGCGRTNNTVQWDNRKQRMSV